MDLIDRETLAVRAAFDVSHADYAYAYELDGAAIVVVADGEMLAVDMEGNVLFRGDAAEATVSSNLPRRARPTARRYAGAWPSRGLSHRPASAPRGRAVLFH